MIMTFSMTTITKVKSKMHHHVFRRSYIRLRMQICFLWFCLHPRSPLRLQPLASLGDSLAHWPCERLGPHRVVVGCHGLCKARLGDPEASAKKTKHAKFYQILQECRDVVGGGDASAQFLVPNHVSGRNLLVTVYKL